MKMVKGRMNNWRLWLQTFSCGLLILAAFAPLPETSHRILTAVAVVGMLTYIGTDSTSRKEFARFMILLAALVSLALLFSVNPKWAIFGAIGVSAGSLLWEVVRHEHAEYAAERERLS